MENKNTQIEQGENNYRQWAPLSEIPEPQQNNETIDVSEDDITQRYETAEKVDEALEILYEQKGWMDNLNALGQKILHCVEMSQIDSKYQTDFPFWRGHLAVYVTASTNEDIEGDLYDQTRFANENEKKILISNNYEKLFGKDVAFGRREEPELVNVNGYNRPEDVKFADETDFTFENKADNQGIPGRINHILYTLFGENTFSGFEENVILDGMGFHDRFDAAKCPDDETVIAAANELIEIANEIGNNGKLEKNISRLEQAKKAFENTAQELVKQEEAYKNQQELAKIAESINDGKKLDLESLILVFSDRNDNDATAISIRNNIGIEASVIKQLLSKE